MPYVRLSDNKFIKNGLVLKVGTSKYTVIDYDNKTIRVRGPSGKLYRWAPEDLNCKAV